MSHKILIIAEHDGQRLNLSTAKCVTCARAIPDADISIAVFAADGAAVATQAAALAGVAQVLRVDHPAHTQLLAANLAPQVAQLAAASSTCSARRPPSARTSCRVSPRCSMPRNCPT
jgi:electron transfer flavoprotein alpha subunit